MENNTNIKRSPDCVFVIDGSPVVFVPEKDLFTVIELQTGAQHKYKLAGGMISDSHDERLHAGQILMLLLEALQVSVDLPVEMIRQDPHIRKQRTQDVEFFGQEFDFLNKTIVLF